MSKIICDICGTSYPETAKQCPICGCVRPGDVQRVTNQVKTDGKVSTGYTYVKGGRFSKSNVKKRIESDTPSKPSNKQAPKNNKDKDTQSSRGLVIAAIVLLLAIIGVVIYIAIHFFGPISGSGNDGTKPSGTQSSQLDLSCRGITLDTDTIILENAGAGQLLNYKLQPENTTDKITFESLNPEIATVTVQGKIVAVAEGTAKILIKCGEVAKECTVVCQFEKEPSTEPTAPTTDPTETTAPTTSQGTIRLNRKDITFSYKGESWVVYSGDIAKNLVTYTSDNEAVATFVDGKVVAVGGGTTTVHASFGDQKVSCIIRCNFQESSGVTGNGGVSEDGGNTGSGTVTGTVNVNDSLRVRSGPGTTYDQVDTVGANERVTITEQQTASDGVVWGKISKGWISMDYVILDSN